MQFPFVRLLELLGIGTHGIEADEEVATDAVSLGVVEGDDVGVIVMLQVLAVYFQYLLIGAKDIGHFAHLLAVGGGYLFHPFGGFSLLDWRHRDVLSLISNHSIFPFWAKVMKKVDEEKWNNKKV